MLESAGLPGTVRARWLDALEQSKADPPEAPLWSWLAEQLEPGNARPRQAAGIEVRRFGSRRFGQVYVLKHAAAGTYLRLTPDEYFVWQRLDGRPLHQLLADYLAARGHLAAGWVVDLLGRLRSAQMLSEPSRPLYASLASLQQRRGWGRFAERLLRAALYVELPLPGAIRAIRLLYTLAGRWCFSRPALWLLGLIALVGLGAYLGAIRRGGFELITSQGSFALGFLVFMVANTLASLVAELGRALATLHFGRAIHTAGLRMLLFTPTFYADTRDIQLEARGARMVVAAAGSAALLVAAGTAGLALLAWPDGLLADFCFKFALLCYGTTIFYLNPLVELDGYTLLSEWLEQPDLRAQSLAFVRGRLLPKLRAQQGLSRHEHGLALFGVLAVVWGAYTAAGAVYLIGWRAAAGLDELLRHDSAPVRLSSLLVIILLGTGLALLVALLLIRGLKQAYLWARRQGLLAGPGPLTGVALAATALVGSGPLLLPVDPAVYRGMVAPPLLMVAILYALRIARDYQGALLRWFFLLLALYSGLIFLGEEVGTLQALGTLELPWAAALDQLLALAGPLACLPFGLYLASLATSRYRAPLGLLGAGVLVFALHPLAPDGRLGAALAAAAGALLAGGVLIYHLVRSLRAAAPSPLGGPALDDATRLSDALAVVAALLLDDLVAQSGWRPAERLQRRFNQLAAEASWELELHELRLIRQRRRDLLSLAPVVRQALGFLCDSAAATAGRPFVERALTRGRDALSWDRREVLDAWVLAELSWGRPLLGRAEADLAELVRFLRRVRLFAGLDQAELEPIARALQPLQVPAGRLVVRQGDPGDTFYLIRSGTVEVRKREPGPRGGCGQEQVVARLGEADAFGELALLYDQPRNATCRAVTPLELLALGRADFDHLVRERFALVGKLGNLLERQRLLAAMPLFSHLAPRELAALAARLEELDLGADQVVVRQAEPGDRFYLVRSGQLAVLVDGQCPSGETGQAAANPGLLRGQVATLGPGEYFGEIALLNNQPRTATVQTLQPTRLFALCKDDFDSLLRGHSAAERDLTQVASRRLLDQQAKTRAQ